jgi:hypothetical protein
LAIDRMAAKSAVEPPGGLNPHCHLPLAAHDQIVAGPEIYGALVGAIGGVFRLPTSRRSLVPIGWSRPARRQVDEP